MTIWLWTGFLFLILLMLLLDLVIQHYRTRELSIQEALAWTCFWIVLALAFNVGVYFIYDQHWLGIHTTLSGKEAALQFFTGYVVEKSLSLDNIFIIALIFSYFHIPLLHQYRVLYWGIFGAIFLRGFMIAGGTLLLSQLAWMGYVFGALLLLTAVRMLIARHDNFEPNRNLFIYLAQKMYPVQAQASNHRFFIVHAGQQYMTPLFLALLMVVSMDIVFALDSIPAILGVTRVPFLVFTSNIFAIMGLRSLYFVLAALIEKFRYLRMSLVFLLSFIGIKMLIAGHWPMKTTVTLSIVLGILSVGILASLCAGAKDTAPLLSPLSKDIAQLCIVTYKSARKVIILVIGTSILLIGIAMLLLPGPGIAAIILGLAILATEITWARILLKRIKQDAQNAGNTIKNFFIKLSQTKPVVKPEQSSTRQAQVKNEIPDQHKNV